MSKSEKSTITRFLSMILGILLLIIIIVQVFEITSIFASLKDPKTNTNVLETTTESDASITILINIIKLIAQLISEIIGVFLSLLYAFTN